MGDANGNGRDPTNGRLLPGNRVAAGNKGSNPTARRMHELRRSILEAEGEENVRSVWVKLRELAAGGDVQAIRLYLEYAFGKPVQALEIGGPDGQAGDLAALTRIVLAALSAHPEARFKLAATLEGIDGESGPVDVPGA
jgi:hypothetical protein